MTICAAEKGTCVRCSVGSWVRVCMCARESACVHACSVHVCTCIVCVCVQCVSVCMCIACVCVWRVHVCTCVQCVHVPAGVRGCSLRARLPVCAPQDPAPPGPGRAGVFAGPTRKWLSRAAPLATYIRLLSVCRCS